MTNLIQSRVEAARAGTNPTVICQVPSGWAVLSDTQFLHGYSLVLADPLVPDLNALPKARRVQFLLDMAIVGDALLEVTGAYRINYEILGNTDPALHAHVIPRYMSEAEALRKGPIWLYDQETRAATPFDAERDRDLMEALAAAIRLRL
jgi:diadenosine tetraphosphate (Ap4A) HIT family hydrolase